VIETADVPWPGVGNVVRQRKQIWLALNLCPADAMVLKLRTDKVGIGEGGNDWGRLPKIERALRGELDLEPAPMPDGAPVFRRRIAVEHGFFLWPFFLCDQVFFGRREDLLRMVEDAWLYEADCDAVAEERFHGSVFARRYPLFRQYFATGEHLGRAIVGYWHCLRTSFRVGFMAPDDPIAEESRQALRRNTAGAWFVNGDPRLGIAGNGDVIVVNKGRQYPSGPGILHDSWVGDFLDGATVADPLGEQALALYRDVVRSELRCVPPVSGQSPTGDA